eukprot:gene16071-7421_t
MDRILQVVQGKMDRHRGILIRELLNAKGDEPAGPIVSHVISFSTKTRKPRELQIEVQRETAAGPSWREDGENIFNEEYLPIESLVQEKETRCSNNKCENCEKKSEEIRELTNKIIDWRLRFKKAQKENRRLKYKLANKYWGILSKFKRKGSPKKKPLLDVTSSHTTPDEFSDEDDFDSLSSEMEDIQSDDEFIPTITSSEDDDIELQQGNKRFDIKYNITKLFPGIFKYWKQYQEKLIEKKFQKFCQKAAKEKDMEIIGEWIRPIENHLFRSALTTSYGDGRLIWAKFKSILCHITNKHTGFNDPIFNKCAHDGNISERKWLKPGW